MAVDHDIEMNRLGHTQSLTEGSSFTVRGPSQSISDAGRSGTTAAAGGGMTGRVGRFLDSFRREDGSDFAFRVTDADADTPGNALRTTVPTVSVVRDHQGDRYYDLRSANSKTASTLLARELKGRHLQMIAISGSIGTGLFVASGKALSEGGPGSLLFAYLIVGVMLYCTVQALGELAVVFPVAGSFSAFSTRFLDPSWGFAMGWKYASLFSAPPCCVVVETGPQPIQSHPAS